MNNSYNYTCIFGGGAVRGLAYIGTIKAMEELGIYPNNLAGSSVGAIIAALLATGYTSSEISDIFINIKFELFKDIYIGFKRKYAISKGDVFTEWVRDLLEKKFYGKNYKKGNNKPVTFKDIEKNLTIITTDFTKFKYKEFSKEATPDFEIATAVRISSTMPGLLTPYEYGNSKLIDGDLLKSWPLWKLSKNLFPDNGRVLEFRLEGNYDSEPKNTLDFINAVYSCVTSIATDNVIESCALKDKIDCIKINTGDVLIVDFNVKNNTRLQIIDMGYNQTINYFKNVLPHKKEFLLSLYKKLVKPLHRLSGYIHRNDILNAKITLGYIFTELCESKEYINAEIYTDLKEFNETLLNSIKTNLFRKQVFKNNAETSEKLDNITNKLRKTITELEWYIKNNK